MPDPAGDAQVPSPRQKVVPDAPVPVFRLVTGRFPVTPPLPEAAKLICATRDASRVPEVIFVALVVFVVAEVANATPPVFIQLMLGTANVQSPPNVNPPKLPELLYWICPELPAAEPVPPAEVHANPFHHSTLVVVWLYPVVPGPGVAGRVAVVQQGKLNSPQKLLFAGRASELKRMRSKAPRNNLNRTIPCLFKLQYPLLEHTLLDQDLRLLL